MQRSAHDTDRPTFYLKSALARTAYRDALVKYATNGVPPRCRRAVSAQVTGLLYIDAPDQTVIAEVLKACASARPATAARAGDRTDTIERLLNAAPTSIVDYGCGDGSITRSMSERWPDATISGIDMAPEPPVEFDAIGGVRRSIPYASNAKKIASASVDLVTALMSLHHMHGVLDDVLREIARIIKPGGRLVIREHDLSPGFGGASMYAFLQLVHIMYDMRDNRLNMAQLIDETRYYSRAEWTRIICTHGFEYVGADIPVTSNSQGVYYAAYQRV